MATNKDHYHAENTYAAESDTCNKCGKWLGAGYLCDDCDTVEGWE
jgi:hypothetical protein